jgi:hypothetical protein
MTAYDTCLSVEAKGQEIITSWLRQLGHVVVFNRHDIRNAEFQTYGDLIVKRAVKDKHELVELKIEETNIYGNLFIETWSNKNWWNPGWLYKTKADWLFYYFIKEDQLYQMKMENLRRFLFETHNTGKVETFAKYQEKPQKKYNQPNQTFGLCVPISDLLKQTGLIIYSNPYQAIKQAA